MYTAWFHFVLDIQILRGKFASIRDGNWRTGAIGGKPTPPQLERLRLDMREYVPRVLRARQ